MGFILAQSETITLPIEVELADEEGRPEVTKFKAKFKRAEQTDVDAMMDEKEPMDSMTVLSRYWIDFSGLKDGNKKVEYTEETRTAMLRVPEAVNAIASTYTNFILQNLKKNNKIDLRSKN